MYFERIVGKHAPHRRLSLAVLVLALEAFAQYFAVGRQLKRRFPVRHPIHESGHGFSAPDEILGKSRYCAYSGGIQLIQTRQFVAYLGLMLPLWVTDRDDLHPVVHIVEVSLHHLGELPDTHIIRHNLLKDP